MANRRWSDEDVADLREQVAAGRSVRDIAHGMMRSQEATRARMQMLGLTKPREFKVAVAKIREPQELTEQ
jgi:hypothetical protein